MRFIYAVTLSCAAAAAAPPPAHAAAALRRRLAERRRSSVVARRLPEAAQRTHDAVLRNATEETCDARLRALRSLVAAGDYAAAVDASFALDGLRGAEADLPASCAADRGFVGAADFIVEVKTPRRREDARARSRTETTARLREADGSSSILPYAGPGVEGPARGRPAVGAVVDGVFVTAGGTARCRERGRRAFCSGGGERDVPFPSVAAAEAAAEALPESGSLARLAAGRPRAVARVADKYSKKIVGAKTMLVSVICPSSDDCATAYDYELIASDHGGDVISYLEEVVALAQDFWTANSWGNFTVDVAITPILEVDYDQSTCDDHDELDWYGGGYDGDPEAFDVLAAHASLAEGYDRESYDFNVVVVPYCQANGAAGTGYVSQEGAFLNLGATNYDPSFVHETGHNFGANHASYVSNDVDDVGGVNAWYDDDDDWVEYGNLYSPMGAGGISADDLSNHFTVEGKAVFDWLLTKYVEAVEPYDDAGSPLCSPCAYTIQATDAGFLEPGYPVALMVGTATEDFHLFVEFRSEHAGALLTWG